MSTPSIALISNAASPNSIDLLESFKAAGLEVTNYRVNTFTIDTDTFQDDQFMNHDVYIFRGFHLSYTFARSLAVLLHQADKVVIDASLYKDFVPSKLHEALLYKKNSIPHPQVLHARTIEEWHRLCDEFSYPIIIKRIDGERGRDVFKCDSAEAVLTAVEKEPFNFIAQEYIQINYDVRVLIVGENILGAIKRTSQTDDFRTNASVGGSAEEYTLSDQEKQIALNAHNVIGYDISGVDIIHKAGKPMVLETNITPEWQAFKQATGINVANSIVEYIKERIEK